MELFPKFDVNSLKPAYAERAKEAHVATGKFLAAEKVATGDVKEAARALYDVAKEKHTALQALAKDATDEQRREATAAAEEAKEALTGFLRGDKAHKVGDTTVQLSDTVGKELRDAFVAAEKAHADVRKPMSSYFGIVRTQKDGWSKAVKANGEKMKFWSSDIEGFAARGKAFAHGSAVVGSVIGMGDAILRSKNSEGEDRSAMMRMAEFVVAGGVGAALLVGGRAVAR